MQHKDGALRIYLVEAVFGVVFVVILVRLFFVQVVKNKDYLSQAKNQHSSERVIRAKRGDILASDGFPLATSRTSYLLFAEPKVVSEPDTYARALAEILVDFSNVPSEKTEDPIYKMGLVKEEEQRLKDLLVRDLLWVVLKRDLSRAKKEAVEKLNLKGLGFDEEAVRFYPEGKLLSQLLGYVAGSSEGEPKGYFGLEGHFDGDLKGKPGRVFEERGATGNVILLGGFRKIPSKDGRSLRTTLNRELQFVVEKKLREGVEKYGAESGSVVIINPVSGDVLALANYPTFDPASFEEEISEASPSEKVLKRNLIISDTYEPGSIIKPVTISAALDLKIVDETSTFVDDGPKTYSGHTIDNWNSKHLGVQTIVQLLEKSNNIGAAWVGTKVGATNLYRYFRRFGFGEYTGTTLEGENAGVLRDSNEWRDIDLATASFGQGIALTPLQIAAAFSVFDNGGKLVKPRVVSSILDDGRSIDIPIEYKRTVISEDTAKRMTNMLISAVDAGEAKFFNVKNYTVAGKTGTAQIPVEGKYDPNKTNATFIGFLPKAPQDKKIVMLVKLEKPSTSIYAAETAVPLWMEILKSAVVLLKVPPDRN